MRLHGSRKKQIVYSGAALVAVLVLLGIGMVASARAPQLRHPPALPSPLSPSPAPASVAMAPAAKYTSVGSSENLPPSWPNATLEAMQWPDGCEPAGVVPAAPVPVSCHEALFPSQTAADGTAQAAAQKRLKAGFVEYTVWGLPKGADAWSEVGRAHLAAAHPNFTLQPPPEWVGAMSGFDKDSVMLAFWIQVPQEGPYTLYLTSRDGRIASPSDLEGGVWIDDVLVMVIDKFDIAQPSAKVGATLGKGWHRISVGGSQQLGRDHDGKAAARAFTLYMEGPSDTVPVEVTPYAEDLLKE